jgi:hypothetical protein
LPVLAEEETTAMTRLEREADHYFPIGGRGYVYCGKSGAQHSVYSPPLSPSLDLTKGAHVEVQNVPILQQPDFRRVTMRYLSLVLAFTGCGDRFFQHQLYCTGYKSILVERHAKFTRSPSRNKQKRLTLSRREEQRHFHTSPYHTQHTWGQEITPLSFY